MATPVYAISANSLTAETFRQAPSSLLAGTGVVGSADLAVTQNSTPNMSVNVAAGQVWVPGTLSSTTGFPTNVNAQTAYGLPSSFNEQASYYAWLNGTTNVVISAADPTNPRVDLVCVYVQDATYSGSNNQLVVGVVTGTPAPSPAVPSSPANSVVLAQVAVAANATSITSRNITDERPFVALTAPSRGNPAGYMYTAVQVNIPDSAFTLVSSMAEGAVYGGVTFSGSGNSLTVPVTGLYRVDAALTWSNAGFSPSASGRFITMVVVNGTGVLQAEVDWTTGQGGYPSVLVVGETVISAGQAVTLSAFQNTGSVQSVSGSPNTGSTRNWLSLSLVSQ